MSNTSIALTFGESSSIGDCSGLMFEIPETSVGQGSTVEFRIWAGTPDSLTGYYITKGGDSMGSGTLIEDTDTDIEVSFDFAEETEKQFDWPIDSITYVEATTPLFYVQDDVIYELATRGEGCLAYFERKGQSCIRQCDNIELYGSIKVTAVRSRWYKKWEWAIPETAEGIHWFFIYQGTTLKHKFSVELPELAESVVAYKDCKLTVHDNDSDVPLEGVTVYVDGVNKGLTDANGSILLPGLRTGTHTLALKDKTGFLDSDVDSTSNDSFVVY